MRTHGSDADGFVQMELGFDRFEASTIVEACRAEGYDVELLQAGRTGLSLGTLAVEPHRLLARAADIDMVKQIVSRSFPQSEQHLDSLSSPPGRRPGRLVVQLVAGAVLVTILVSVGQQIVSFL